MPWFVLGLCGVTNSGKSTVAAKLIEMYPNTVYIKQDDYFLSEDDPRHVIIQGLGHQNWELLSSLDMDRMVDDVQRAKAVNPPDKRLLILDGFLLYDDPRILPECDLKVYVDIDFETCRNRRAQRVYEPPDIPGYFEQVVWPEAQAAKQRMLSRDGNIIVLDGKLPLQAMTNLDDEDVLEVKTRNVDLRPENLPRQTCSLGCYHFEKWLLATKAGLDRREMLCPKEKKKHPPDRRF